MTLAELAERAGVTVVNLSVLKNDRARAIRFSTLTQLCDVLRMPARRPPASRAATAGRLARVGEAQRMKGISLLVDRLYSGYESGNVRAMVRSSAMAL